METFIEVDGIWCIATSSMIGLPPGREDLLATLVEDAVTEIAHQPRFKRMAVFGVEDDEQMRMVEVQALVSGKDDSNAVEADRLWSLVVVTAIFHEKISDFLNA